MAKMTKDPRGLVERAAAGVTRVIQGKTPRSINDSPAVQRQNRTEDRYVSPHSNVPKTSRTWVPGEQASGAIGRAIDARIEKKMKDAGA